MDKENADLVEKMRRQSNAVYLATEQEAAADISGSLMKAAAEIVRLEEMCAARLDRINDLSSKLVSVELMLKQREGEIGDATVRLGEESLKRIECERRLDAYRTAVAQLVYQLQEVRANHRDPESSEYNDCEKPGEECCWCDTVQRTIDSLPDRPLKAPSE